MRTFVKLYTLYTISILYTSLLSAGDYEPQTYRYSRAASTLSGIPAVLQKLMHYDERITALEPLPITQSIVEELLLCWFEKAKLLRKAEMITEQEIQKVIYYAELFLTYPISEEQRRVATEKLKSAQGSLQSLKSKVDPERDRLLAATERLQEKRRRESVMRMSLYNQLPSSSTAPSHSFSGEQLSSTPANIMQDNPAKPIDYKEALETAIQTAKNKPQTNTSLLEIANLYYKKSVLTHNLQDRKEVYIRATALMSRRGMLPHELQHAKILVNAVNHTIPTEEPSIGT